MRDLIQTSANGYAVICGRIEDHTSSVRELPWAGINNSGVMQFFKTRDEAINFARGF